MWRLLIDATGFLHDDRQEPEKSWRQLDAVKLARSFALNGIGPALIMKHLRPRDRRDRNGRIVRSSLGKGSDRLESDIPDWTGECLVRSRKPQFP